MRVCFDIGVRSCVCVCVKNRAPNLNGSIGDWGVYIALHSVHENGNEWSVTKEVSG